MTLIIIIYITLPPLLRWHKTLNLSCAMHIKSAAVKRNQDFNSVTFPVMPQSVFSPLDVIFNPKQRHALARPVLASFKGKVGTHKHMYSNALTLVRQPFA